MRPLRLVPVLALLLVAACADMKALFALSSALQRQYGVAATVTLSNDSHLVITFQEPPPAMAKADSAGRAQVAESIAAFAKAHYPGAGQLEDVTVAFAHVRTMGPLTITQRDAPYSFAVHDLP